MVDAETELKLQLNPRQIDLLKGRALLAEAAQSQAEIDDIYFDTADQLLRRHKMALRLRRIDGRWLQTLKTDGKSGGALSRRGEWETPAKVVRATGLGQIDLPRLHQSPLPALLAGQKMKPPLRPLFRTRVQRTLWAIKHSSTAIEVALDVGQISVDTKEKTGCEPICELELELKGGEAAVVLDVALELLGADGKTPLTLIPLARSKAARGYQLAARRPAAAVKASAKGFVADLTSKTTVARVLRAVIAHGLAVLTANAELLLRYDDPEYVHQARVALRRVRSAIRLFDREHRDVPQSLADELRWCARALGAARDWDVIADETVPSLAEDGVDAIATLASKADQRRCKERATIRSEVQSPRYAALVLRGERWCLTPAPADAELLGDAAGPALQSAAKKLFKEARFFSALTPERRHQVRILAKRLRYALDLFAVALPKQAAARYIKALSELQDVLGELNDATVAKNVLPQLSKSVRLKKSVQSHFAAAEPGRVHDAEQRLLKLSKLQTPWDR